MPQIMPCSVQSAPKSRDQRSDKLPSHRTKSMASRSIYRTLPRNAQEPEFLRQARVPIFLMIGEEGSK